MLGRMTILIFLMFLLIYQTNPDIYFETFNKTFSNLDDQFDKQFNVENVENHQEILNVAIDFFIISILASFYAGIVLTALIATMIPIDAKTLIDIFLFVVILSLIPWTPILGIGLLIKDWWKRRGTK